MDAVRVRRPVGDSPRHPPLRLKGLSPPALPTWPVVNALLPLPLAQQPELVEILWDSIAAEEVGPELSGG